MASGGEQEERGAASGSREAATGTKCRENSVGGYVKNKRGRPTTRDALVEFVAIEKHQARIDFSSGELSAHCQQHARPAVGSAAGTAAVDAVIFGVVTDSVVIDGVVAGGVVAGGVVTGIEVPERESVGVSEDAMIVGAATGVEVVAHAAAARSRPGCAARWLGGDTRASLPQRICSLRRVC